VPQDQNVNSDATRTGAFSPAPGRNELERTFSAAPGLNELVGPYRLDAQLGNGGMGIVYRAHDTRLRRHVALKIIRPSSLSAVTRAAFFHEAQLASSLNHPGIVTIYDILRHGELDCIVMEYIDGASLRDAIPKGVSLEEANRIFVEIAYALRAAHRAGIIHLDIKPNNIMLTSDGRAKVVDFGLSVARRSTAGDDTVPVAIFSGIVGTPAYIAPEMLRGEQVDHRADIFALTIVLFETLTGKLPFSGSDAIGQMRALMSEDPATLSSARPELAALDAVIQKGLQKHPAARYQNIDELLEDFARAKSAKSGASGFDSQRSFAGPPSTGSESTSVAVLPFRSVSQDPDDVYLASGIASELISAMTGLPGLRIAPQTAAYREHERGADPVMAARNLKTRYVVTGSLRRAKDRIRVCAELIDCMTESVAWTRNYDRLSVDIFEVQEDIAGSIVKSLGGQLIRATTDFAFRTPTENLDAWGLLRKAYHIWNYEFSVEGVQNAVALCRRAVALDPDYSKALASLSIYLIQSVIHSISPTPEADAEESLRSANRAIELAPEDTEVLAPTSIVLLHTGHSERGKTLLRRATRIAPYDLVSWGYLGLILGASGGRAELAESAKILKLLIADAPDHPSLPYWCQFLAITALRREEFDTAVESAQRAVELQPGFVHNLLFLSEALCRSGRTDEARQVLARVRSYNPAFTISFFEKFAVTSCGKQEYVDQLCGCSRALGVL
jgi:serine/threonine-protein kinase